MPPRSPISGATRLGMSIIDGSGQGYGPCSRAELAGRVCGRRQAGGMYGHQERIKSGQGSQCTYGASLELPAAGVRQDEMSVKKQDDEMTWARGYNALAVARCQ